MGKVQVFQPKYFKDFVCTGTKCVHNCCNHNWQIRVDKNTYDKYIALGDKGTEMLEHIKIITEDPFLALITKGKNNRCKYLTDEGLCNLQLTLGYDYLCRTCRIYPRNITYINGEFETFLELSCEEAVRVVMFNEDYMDFEEAILEPDGCGNYIPNRILNAEKYTPARNGVEIFHKLRSASVAIMQSRQYKIRVRLMILCLFIQQVSDQIKAGNDANIPLFSEVFVDALRTGVYDSVAEELPDGIEPDFGLVINILKDMATRNDIRFNNILKHSLDAFTIASGELPDNFSSKYKEIYSKYFTDNEFIFENYIVNHILLYGFPFNYRNESDVMSNYADMLAKYNLIEFLLTGICKHYGKFEQWNIIDCVSSFSRCYENTLNGFLMHE